MTSRAFPHGRGHAAALGALLAGLTLVFALVIGASAAVAAPPSPPPGTSSPAKGTPSGSPGLPPCPGASALPALGAPAPPIDCGKAGPGQPTVVPPGPMPTPKQGGDSCGTFDVGCYARQAVTGWFKDTVTSAIAPMFTLLGLSAFSTPDIDSPEMARAREIWGTSQTIANTCFVLLVTIAGVLLLAGTSLPREFSMRQIVPRLVLAFLAANLSLQLIGYLVEFANGLAFEFMDAGGDKIDPAQAADVLGGMVQASVNTAGIFLVLLALAVTVLATCVAFVFVVRLAITMVLIAAAPLALMFLALPFTEGIAVLWWRGLAGMLAIQVCQSLVFVTAMQLLFSSDTVGDVGHGGPFGIPTNGHDATDLLLIICLLWILIRIPSWVARTIWMQARPRLIPQLIKSFLIYRTVGAVVSRITRHRTPGPRPARGGAGPGRPGGSPGGAPRRPARPGGGGGGGGTPRPASGTGPGSPTNNGPRPGTGQNSGPAAGGKSANGQPSSGQPRPGPARPSSGATGYRPSHGGYPRQPGGYRTADYRPGRSQPTGQPTPAAETRPTPRRPAPAPREVITLRIEPRPRRKGGR